MSFFSFYCPVPREQRPIYEYLKTKNSAFLCWPTLKSSEYFFRTLIIFLIGFMSSFPFINNIISIHLYPLKFFFVNCCIPCLELFLFFLYLYLNWFYLQSRLENPTTFYEESSWYDGKMWVKPATILKQERLIAYYQILPLLLRLRNSIHIIIIGFFLSLVNYFIF